MYLCSSTLWNLFFVFQGQSSCCYFERSKGTWSLWMDWSDGLRVRSSGGWQHERPTRHRDGSSDVMLHRRSRPGRSRMTQSWLSEVTSQVDYLTGQRTCGCNGCLTTFRLWYTQREIIDSAPDPSVFTSLASAPTLTREGAEGPWEAEGRCFFSTCEIRCSVQGKMNEALANCFHEDGAPRRLQTELLV